jgi:hypothetical protein
LLWHLSFLLHLFILPLNSWPQLHGPETWLTPLLSLKTNHRPHSPLYNNTPTCSRHSSWAAWPLMMGPIGCPETSVGSSQPIPRNIPEERRPYWHPGWSLNSRARKLFKKY